MRMPSLFPSLVLSACLSALFGHGTVAQNVTPAPELISLSLGGQSELSLMAFFEDFADSVYGHYKREEVLQDFRPAIEQAPYGNAAFQVFLPEGSVEVGETWEFEPEVALPFLLQIHPGARARFRLGRGTAGAYACLRAVNEDSAEILLRVHAEFLLKDAKRAEERSWFMPAQFAGRLLIDRKSGQVTFFSLSLPPRNTNVDVNIPSGQGVGFLADIGFVPRMEVLSKVVVAPTFKSEITTEEALHRLALRFYAFEAIEWLDVPAALKRSKETGQSMHILTMFGTLDDESC